MRASVGRASALLLVLLATAAVASSNNVPLAAATPTSTTPSSTAAAPSTVLHAEALARAGLAAWMAASCAKDPGAMRAALADNATVFEADHDCYGPFDAAGAVAQFSKNFQWFAVMMRPVAAVVALPGTAGDPSGGAEFVATFTDVGVYPLAVRNETAPDWSFLMGSVVTGAVDRNGALTAMSLHMDWASADNTALKAAAHEYFVAMTTGTIDALLALFRPDATIRSRGAPYGHGAGGGTAYNHTMNLTEYAALMRPVIALRTHGRFQLSAAAAGCGQAAVLNTVVFEAWTNASRTARGTFMAHGHHVFVFDTAWKIVAMTYLQLEARAAL